MRRSWSYHTTYLPAIVPSATDGRRGLVLRGDTLTAVYLHGQPIGRGESEAATLAVRRACEEAVKRCKGEGLLDSVCTCPRKTKKSRQADPAV